jgi:hypothetical protein
VRADLPTGAHVPQARALINLAVRFSRSPLGYKALVATGIARAEIMRLFCPVVLICLASPALAEVQVIQASIAEGRLIVTGQVAGEGEVSLDDRFTTKPDDAGKFEFRLPYHPATCMIRLKSAEDTFEAVVANCGQAGPRGEAGAAGPQGVAGPPGEAGPVGPPGLASVSSNSTASASSARSKLKPRPKAPPRYLRGPFDEQIWMR